MKCLANIPSSDYVGGHAQWVPHNLEMLDPTNFRLPLKFYHFLKTFGTVLINFRTTPSIRHDIFFFGFVLFITMVKFHKFQLPPSLWSFATEMTMMAANANQQFMPWHVYAMFTPSKGPVSPDRERERERESVKKSVHCGLDGPGLTIPRTRTIFRTDFLGLGGIARQSEFSGPDLSDKSPDQSARALFLCDVRARVVCTFREHRQRPPIYRCGETRLHENDLSVLVLLLVLVLVLGLVRPGLYPLKKGNFTD